jgi:hypothetical protein
MFIFSMYENSIDIAFENKRLPFWLYLHNLKDCPDKELVCEKIT